MSKEFDATIDVLVKRVDAKTKELAEAKRLVNALCREAGKEPRYSDADDPVMSSTIRPDQFYGKTPIVAAREFLDMKKAAGGGAVALQEILDGLTRGGFDFDAQGWTEPDARLRNLGISIGKNSSIFHRLPNDFIGLKKFYPGLKEKKTKAALTANKNSAMDGDADGDADDATDANGATDGQTKAANADLWE